MPHRPASTTSPASTTVFRRLHHITTGISLQATAPGKSDTELLLAEEFAANLCPAVPLQEYTL